MIKGLIQQTVQQIETIKFESYSGNDGDSDEAN